MRYQGAVVAGLAVAMLATLNCSGPSRRQSGAQPVGAVDSESQALVEGHRGGVFRLIIEEPAAIDPSNVADEGGLQIATYLFAGLVTGRPDGTVSAGVATSWRPDAGCTQWMFQLRHGTRFHNGEEVTSRSFARGWRRAANGGAAFLLESIRDVDTSNPYVLEVKLARPDCDFPRRMFHPVFSPVPSSAGAIGNRAYNDQPIGNGPFAMDGPWSHDRGIRLVRNDDFELGAKANLDAAELTISVDPAADSNTGLRAGAADWTRVAPTDLDSLHDQPDRRLIFGQATGTYYLVPMVTIEPLDVAAARRALSLAIDRDAIIREVFDDGLRAATSLVPPLTGMAAAPKTLDACRFDPVEARRLAVRAGLTAGTVLHFRYNDDGGHEAWSVAVKRQLETNLGIKVNYYGLPFVKLRAEERAPGASGISRGGWGLDYPSADNILAQLTTAAIGTADPAELTNGDNIGRYRNPRFDRLLDRARATVDEASRSALYRQAEAVAIGEDLALIPLWYTREYRLVASDRFTNVRMDWWNNANLSLISLR